MNENKNIPSKVESRLKLLQQFRIYAKMWFDGDYNNEGQEELRKNIDAGAMQSNYHRQRRWLDDVSPKRYPSF
jgi:hypothetical protein